MYSLYSYFFPEEIKADPRQKRLKHLMCKQIRESNIRLKSIKLSDIPDNNLLDSWPTEKLPLEMPKLIRESTSDIMPLFCMPTIEEIQEGKKSLKPPDSPKIFPLKYKKKILRLNKNKKKKKRNPYNHF